MVRIGSERIYPPRIPLGRTWEWLRSRTYGSLDAVVALTQESADWLQQHTNAKYIPVIPNPVVYPLPSREPYLPVPARRQGEHRLLAVGRLDVQKGFDILIPVFARLAHRLPQWNLVILGEGPERSRLTKQINALNMQERIFLPGRAGNVADWYMAADIYVMNSRFEGFPNSLLEALAHGLPSVSFDCETGPRDLIEDDVNGFLVPPDNTPLMEGALRLLMSDANLRSRMAEKASLVAKKYSLERISSEWMRIFGAD